MASLRFAPMPSIREVLRLYDLRARRQLAQNFLLDPRVIARFVRAVGPISRDDTVLEVGPGPGGITRALLEKRPARMTVVELDNRFMPILEGLRSAAEVGDVPLDVFNADILHFNLEDFLPSSDTARLHLVGNLPFNVSLPLLVRWLHDVAERRGAWRPRDGPTPHMTLTFQKEVAQRLAAPIWTPQRSRLSVLAQAWCDVRFSAVISGAAFVPPPLVDVGVVRLEPLAQPRIRAAFPVAMRLVRAAFRLRRKQLVRCLEALYPPSCPELVVQLFREAGIFPTRRAVELSVEEFADLCDVYSAQCRREPNLLEYDFRSKQNAVEWRRQTTRLTADTIQDDMLKHRFGIQGFSALQNHELSDGAEQRLDNDTGDAHDSLISR